MAQRRRSGPVHTHPSQPCVGSYSHAILCRTFRPLMQATSDSMRLPRGACQGRFVSGRGGGSVPAGRASLREPATKPAVRRESRRSEYDSDGTTATGRPSVGRVARSGDRATAQGDRAATAGGTAARAGRDAGGTAVRRYGGRKRWMRRLARVIRLVAEGNRQDGL